MLLLLMSIVLGLILRWEAFSKEVSVSFLDVGQGDAILINQGTQQILIDGGRNATRLKEHLGRLVPFWDRNIDVVIATHPDVDHIGGLVDLFSTYSIDNLIATRVESDSKAFQQWEHNLTEHGVQRIDAKENIVVKLSSGAQLRVLYPFDLIDDSAKLSSNESSIVSELSFAGTRFLFTGDLPDTIEETLVLEGVDILKVGHHGSKHSSSEDFLKMLQPRDSIISVGKNNSYGHPSQEVLQRLFEVGSRVLRTDQSGTIQYVCAENLGCSLKSL